MRKKSTDIAKVSYVFVLNIHKGFWTFFCFLGKRRELHNLNKMEEAESKQYSAWPLMNKYQYMPIRLSLGGCYEN